MVSSTPLKKSLVRVCKTWHAVSLEFLYADVVFRRISQISAFLRTLETSRIPGNLVKKITISAYIPSKYSMSCQKHLQRIFSFCRHVHHFTLASPIELPDIITLPTSQHITTLEVTDTFSYDSLLPVLVRVCHTLRSLSFYPTKSDALRTAVRFPQLNTLVCKFSSLQLTPYDGHTVDVISSAWSMPALESLGFSCPNDLNLRRLGQPWKTMHTFFLAHGGQLRFLELVIPWSQSIGTAIQDMLDGCPSTTIQDILDACPSLEHLVTIWDNSLSISHRNIKWIDLWPSILPQCVGNDFPWIHWAKMIRQASEFQTALPALQGIRILLHGLPFIFNIPLLIPPTRWATHKDTFSL